MSHPWVFAGLKPADIPGRLGDLGAAYRQHGLVVLPGLLVEDPDFQGFLEGVRYLLGRIFARHGETLKPGVDIGDAIVRLKQIAPLDGQIVADMGTQHNKLAAANRVKYADFVMHLLSEVFGSQAVIATPQAGDTLHLFMPGEEFHRYNLPIHQDYPYLMQSPRQATLYLSLSREHDGVGGLEYWPGSQRLGVLPADRNEHGSFRVVDGEALMSSFPCVRYSWAVGDVALFNSLLCHRSIPTTSRDRGRSVQIFRYSDLNDPTAEAYDWRSTVYERRGVTFETAHSDLFRS